MLRFRFLAVCSALATVGCGSIEPIAPKVTPALAACARVELGELEHGRVIYTTRCVLCHTSERVSKYSRREWTGILERMTEEAGLNDAQERAVRAYVMALVER